MRKAVPPTKLPPDDGRGANRDGTPVRPTIDPATLTSFFDNHGTLEHLRADRVVSDLASVGPHLALLTSGMLVASLDLPDDRRQVLSIFCPGDVIFAQAFKTTAAVRLRALSDAELRVLTPEALEAAREAAPITLSLLLATALNHLSELMLHSAALGRLRSDERLATFFLELALRRGQSVGPTATLDFEMRRDDIADYLGLNPDTLSRSMSRLRRENVISFLTAGRVIANLEALAARTPLGAAMLAANRAA